ncbi:MAG: hypothetical protein HN392_03345 [Anaerolineae bacterium]|nr:hypothetical protein [Anaerolineae bacterium]MBT7189108.1 hypothetical protein [Anaerolineae bacterium]MBT7783445.1 hypothetical protein [Anaerolineae bacterium]
MSILSNRSVIHPAAKAATVLYGLTAFLQLLLAAGILPVTMAWGGRQSVLTPGLRVLSLVAIAILVFFAYVIRRRAKLIDGVVVPTFVKILAWVITAYSALNFLGVITSLSMGEKLLFGPISFFLLIACFLISSSKEAL